MSFVSISHMLAVSVLALALPPAALASDGLPLAEAQRLALQRSRQVAASDAAIAASRDMAIAAGQLPDPVLTVGIDNLPAGGADRGRIGADAMTMRRVGIAQEITRADKRMLRTERYTREAEREAAGRDRAVAAVERDTALAWLDRYYAEAAAAVITDQRTLARRELDAAEAALRAGRGSLADVLAARGAAAQLDDRADDAARRTHGAAIALARWVGDAAQRPLAGLPAIDSVRPAPATLESALARHPDVAVLSGEAAVAAVEARLAEAGRRPDWSVEVTYQQRGAAYPNMVSFGVSVPLQWDRPQRQDRELAARLARAEQAAAERDDLVRARVAEVRAMLAEWQSNRARLVRYRAELVPLAQERSAAVLAAYRGGKAALADVLAAQRGALDVRLSAVQLEAETARLWAQLNHLFPAARDAHADAIRGDDK